MLWIGYYFRPHSFVGEDDKSSSLYDHGDASNQCASLFVGWKSYIYIYIVWFEMDGELNN